MVKHNQEDGHSPQALYVGSFERAHEALEEIVGPDDLVLLMGAGDIKKLGDDLAHQG